VAYNKILNLFPCEQDANGFLDTPCDNKDVIKDW